MYSTVKNEQNLKHQLQNVMTIYLHCEPYGWIDRRVKDFQSPATILRE